MHANPELGLGYSLNVFDILIRGCGMSWSEDVQKNIYFSKSWNISWFLESPLSKILVSTSLWNVLLNFKPTKFCEVKNDIKIASSFATRNGWDHPQDKQQLKVRSEHDYNMSSLSECVFPPLLQRKAIQEVSVNWVVHATQSFIINCNFCCLL